MFRSATQTRAPGSAVTASRAAVLVTLLLGVFLLLGAGFAPIPALHDAAHDGRHSFAFPCH